MHGDRKHPTFIQGSQIVNLSISYRTIGALYTGKLLNQNVLISGWRLNGGNLRWDFFASKTQEKGHKAKCSK
jgi:hypothetical protein